MFPAKGNALTKKESLPLKREASIKRNNFHWCGIVFFSELAFVVHELSFEIDNYVLFLCYKKRSTKNKILVFLSGVHPISQQLLSIFLYCVWIIDKQPMSLNITFYLSKKVHSDKVCHSFFLWSLVFSLLKIAELPSKIIYIQKVKEVVSNYCIQRSSVEDQEIDSSIISLDAMSYIILWFLLNGIQLTRKYWQILGRNSISNSMRL